jgi:DNA replication licensing factor MCM4
LFKTYLDVVHIKMGGGGDGRLAFDKSTRPGGGDRIPGVGGEDLTDTTSTTSTSTRLAAMEAHLLTLSQRPDVYDLLSRSLAPSIWEMNDEKKGILLQLFGGTNKSVKRGGGGGGPRYRGDINVLMVGDPGSGKSQILQVHVLSAYIIFARLTGYLLVCA